MALNLSTSQHFCVDLLIVLIKIKQQKTFDLLSVSVKSLSSIAQTIEQ